ncbi:hypothetical protein Tco_0721386, partial [Tanacetum coccineum]
MDFMIHPVYIDAHITPVVHNPEGNPELTSYISCAFEVPLGTHIDVLATITLVQEMFPEENSHHITSLPAKKIPYPITTPQPSSLQAKAKKLMQKAKKNMRKINFKKAFIQKFIKYDQKPHLNTFVLEVMKTNQINLFTQSSTSIDDLLDMDLKIKLLNRIHLNKSNETHTTHKQLYDTLYESITLDQDALDAQGTQLSFHKRSHDNQDPPNNREGENKKKRRKDVYEPSSRSTRQNRYHVVIVQDDTPAMQPMYKADTLIQKHSNPEWFPKKSGLAKRRTTWFDLFLKSDIDKDENHILGPSIVAIAKKFKELIQKDELSIADLEGARLERLKVQNNNDVKLEYHVSQFKAAVLLEARWDSDMKEITEEKYTTFITKHYAARYYKEGIEDRIPERWSKEVPRYHFEALNGIHHREENRIDFFKAGMSVVTKGNVFSNLRIKLVVHIDVKKKWGYGFLTSIIVRRSDDKEYEFSYADLPRLSVNNVEDMYLLQVQDKLLHLPLEFL